MKTYTNYITGNFCSICGKPLKNQYCDVCGMLSGHKRVFRWVTEVAFFGFVVSKKREFLVEKHTQSRSNRGKIRKTSKC